MTRAATSGGEVRLQVHNVGGIDETELTISPGITVLSGRNATNRTSLLQAIMAVLGSESDVVSLKGSATEGRVEATIDGDRYTRRLRRQDGRIRRDGEPYLDDPELADLFAFLLESNEVRRTVARGDDLRAVLTRPIDTGAIEREIDERLADRRELDAQLEELEDQAERCRELEREHEDLQATLADKRDKLAAVRADLDELGDSPGEAGESRSRGEDLLADLRAVRSELDEVQFQLRSERDSLEALREERAELDATAEDVETIPDEDIAALEATLDELRRRKRELTEQIGELQNVVQFNEELLSSGESGIRTFLESDDGEVTDALVSDEAVRCWTCGSAVERGQIEATLEQLRTFLETQYDRRDDVQSEIDAAAERRDSLQERQQRREELSRRQRETATEIDRREERIAELVDRRDALATRVEELETELDGLETREFGAVLERHREANELEFEIGRHERRLEEIESELASLETALDQREELADRRATVQSEIEELRTRVERIETEAVEAFNEHAATLLDLLDYDNLERVWIERLTTSGDRRDAAREFTLHVVRSDDSGTTYEDAFAHLSESEREVVGLVFALAGYLVHDVHEVAPFVLLDSLEAIDSARIATLVEYFAEYADYLVVALLPEDAQAVAADHQTVTSI